MSTTVKYKGSDIATVDNETKTLKTSGKWVEADIVLTDVSVDLSNSTVEPEDVVIGNIFYDSEGKEQAGVLMNTRVKPRVYVVDTTLYVEELEDYEITDDGGIIVTV